MNAVTWHFRNKAHRMRVDGRDVDIKIVFKPRFQHFGVYQVTEWYRHRESRLLPSWRKIGSGLTIDEAKAVAVALYRLNK